MHGTGRTLPGMPGAIRPCVGVEAAARGEVAAPLTAGRITSW